MNGFEYSTMLFYDTFMGMILEKKYDNLNIS